MSIHVGRDPFARAQYHKTTFKSSDNMSCDWCGNKKERLFSYTWEEDQRNQCPPKYLNDRKFCNFSCFKTYYS